MSHDDPRLRQVSNRSRGATKAPSPPGVARMARTLGALVPFIAVVIFGTWPRSANAATAVDATSSGYTASSGLSSITISHTTPVSDRLVLVGGSISNDGNETVSSVTWNGTESLTRVGQVANANDAMVKIWRLLAPSTGTGNVVVTFSAALLQRAVAGVMAFTDVDQTAPRDTFACATGNNSCPATVDVLSAASEPVVGVSCAEYEAVTAYPQPQRWNVSVPTSGSTNGARSAEAAAARTLTTSWTLDPPRRSAVGGVSMKTVSGTGATWAADEETKLTGLSKARL